MEGVESDPGTRDGQAGGEVDILHPGSLYQNMTGGVVCTVVEKLNTI